jgi:transglutaminase-like putative cysteine protease
LSLPAAPPSIASTVEYEVVERLTLANKGPGQPDKQRLWIALIRDLPPYQEVHSMQVEPGEYRLMTDEYGNQYAEFDLTDLPAGSNVSIQIRYQVAVHELTYELVPCEGELPTEFTRPELHIESNNAEITDLANRLSDGQQTACDVARAFYDYVGDNLVYSYNSANWGAQAALGEMGADCTEYASLMIALCRAAGIPARYVEGLVLLNERTQDSARTEHAWLEVYLPGIGWTPMDPTMGRYPISRKSLFARHSPDHIVVTRGRNPSTLRGASYWSHLYWPGNSTEIRVEDFEWTFTALSD